MKLYQTILEKATYKRLFAKKEARVICTFLSGYLYISLFIFFLLSVKYFITNITAATGSANITHLIIRLMGMYSYMLSPKKVKSMTLGIMPHRDAPRYFRGLHPEAPRKRLVKSMGRPVNLIRKMTENLLPTVILSPYRHNRA